MGEQTIRTCLKKLKTFKILTIKVTNKYSIITLLNWATYQHTELETNHQSNQQVTSSQPTTNHKQEHKEHKEHIIATPEEQKILDDAVKYLEEQWNRKFKDYSSLLVRIREGAKSHDLGRVVLTSARNEYLTKNQHFRTPDNIFGNDTNYVRNGGEL